MNNSKLKMNSIKLEEESDDEMPVLERMDYCFEYPNEIKLEEPDITLECFPAQPPLQNEYVQELLKNDCYKQELLVPKEEEPDDHQDFRQLDPSDDGSFSDSKRNSQVYRKCQVCNRLMSIELMTKTELNDSKLVLLVGSILGGSMMFKEAKLLISEPVINACHVHFSDALDKIFVYFGIGNNGQMQDCSDATISEVIKLTARLSPSPISIEEFYYLLSNFTQKLRPLHNTVLETKERISDRLPANNNQGIYGYVTSHSKIPYHVSKKFPFFFFPKVENRAVWIPDSRPRLPVPRRCSPKCDFNESCSIFSPERSVLHPEIPNQQSCAKAGRCIIENHLPNVVPPVLNFQKPMHFVRGSLPPPPPRVRSYNKKCTVCHEAPGKDKIMTTRSRDKQLVLFVGLVLGLQKSIIEAQKLCSKSELIFCKTHLKDAVVDILKFLEIEHIHHMRLCSADKKEKLIAAVHFFNPGTTFADFVRVVNDTNRRLTFI
ncbi:unnamed protein product [Caenorhabditis brenneri]